MALQRSVGMGLQSFMRTSRKSLSDVLGSKGALATRIHVFLGNEAADPDSIVSSLCSAYLSHCERGTGAGYGDTTTEGTVACVPMCCIPRSDLALRRDTKLLFDMAGLDINDLICLDDNEEYGYDALHELQRRGLLSITLTDHNALASSVWSADATATLGSCVVEIIDHHTDKGEHAHVVGARRDIAFDAERGRELVGSACTLIAERALGPITIDPRSAKGSGEQGSTIEVDGELAMLLSGVILLDTSNMDPTVDKGRPRDDSALSRLLQAAQAEVAARGGREAMYVELQGAKSSPEFWTDLSAADALRLDYKRFQVEPNLKGEEDSARERPRPRFLGMSSLILPVSSLLDKPDVHTSLQGYLNTAAVPVDLLVCMCMVLVSGDRRNARRELLAVGSAAQLDALATFLSTDEGAVTMAVERMGERLVIEAEVERGGVLADAYRQGNVRMSRKQVGPILERFLSTVCPEK